MTTLTSLLCEDTHNVNILIQNSWSKTVKNIIFISLKEPFISLTKYHCIFWHYNG